MSFLSDAANRQTGRHKDKQTNRPKLRKHNFLGRDNTMGLAVVTKLCLKYPNMLQDDITKNACKTKSGVNFINTRKQ